MITILAAGLNLLRFLVFGVLRFVFSTFGKLIYVSCTIFDQTGGISPLERVPCANCHVPRRWGCKKPVTFSCNECHLVSYCSVQCKDQHWPTHQGDCESALRSPEWVPAWTLEGRVPSFVSFARNPDEMRRDWLKGQTQLGRCLGMTLIGNMPAIDVLNLGKNEGAMSKNRDLYIAFPASGDLRNLVKTVNSLPEDYDGHMKILLNDRDPFVAVRNLVLLMVLGTERDVPKAAELALHLWYSAFVQQSHPLAVLSIIRKMMYSILNTATYTAKLGETSTLTASLSQDSGQVLATLATAMVDYHQAFENYQGAFLNPSRVDFHHRRYSPMQPSHRVAFHDFRLFGLVFPFGAPNAHFNRPNRFLFSPDGQWLQSDGSNPFSSWEKEEVISAGKRHGASREDIFGCLYFFLSEQLRTFADRLQRFHITIHILDQDATTLASKIKSGSLHSVGIPPHVRFDRIEVSSIFDMEYVGIPKTLADWGPMLDTRNPHATLVGHLVNWATREPGGSIVSDDPSRSTMIRETMNKMAEAGRLPPSRPQGGVFEPRASGVIDALAAFYDNSVAFAKYLRKQNVEKNAKKVGLKLKTQHTIVPHRLFAPIEGPPDALPRFQSGEEWYLNAQISEWSLYERFVEFGPQ